MSLFKKFKEGLQKTQSLFTHEIKRLVTLSPKVTAETLEELEAVLLAADLGTAMTEQIVQAVKRAYETQGRSGLELLKVAEIEVESVLAALPSAALIKKPGVTVVSIVGVNGTGKTTTAAKLAYWLQQKGDPVVLAACDTFRAAAIEQLKLWGTRLEVPVVAGDYGADAAAVAHDALGAAQARNARYLLVDTAGRLHTKHNLMQELHKLHRVIDKKLPGSPHEILLVLDATTGMNALNQAREFHKTV